MKVKISPLDKLFSEFVRKRAIKLVHGCQRCLTWKSDYKELQCSHFWGKKRKSIRWDVDDAVGLCGACHMYFHSQPLEHTEWFRSHLGEEAFDMLSKRASMLAKYVDENAIFLYLEEQIKEVQDD